MLLPRGEHYVAAGGVVVKVGRSSRSRAAVMVAKLIAYVKNSSVHASSLRCGEFSPGSFKYHLWAFINGTMQRLNT
jgi:hypothetical protein